MQRHNEGRWKKATYSIQRKDGRRGDVVVAGRARWALECLISAGERGCTPIDTPGPRWSDYVFKLRGQGLTIETITEKHEGPFSGTHARYVLRSIVTLAHVGEVAA